MSQINSVKEKNQLFQESLSRFSIDEGLDRYLISQKSGWAGWSRGFAYGISMVSQASLEQLKTRLKGQQLQLSKFPCKFLNYMRSSLNNKLAFDLISQLQQLQSVKNKQRFYIMNPVIQIAWLAWFQQLRGSVKVIPQRFGFTHRINKTNSIPLGCLNDVQHLFSVNQRVLFRFYLGKRGASSSLSQFNKDKLIPKKPRDKVREWERLAHLQKLVNNWAIIAGVRTYRPHSKFLKLLIPQLGQVRPQ